MDDGRNSWKLLPRERAAAEPTATTRPVAAREAPGAVVLERADARLLLALLLELETLATETHAGTMFLRTYTGMLTMAVSPTDYTDRETILRARKVCHDYLDWFRRSDAGPKVTERSLSDPEEGA